MQDKITGFKQVNVCLCVYRTLQVGQSPEAPCMSHCNCYTSFVSPVCGSNGVTYLSSCFAGCTRAISTGLPPPLSQVITHLIYTTMFVSRSFFSLCCHILSVCLFLWLSAHFLDSSCPAWVIRSEAHNAHQIYSMSERTQHSACQAS